MFVVRHCCPFLSIVTQQVAVGDLLDGLPDVFVWSKAGPSDSVESVTGFVVWMLFDLLTLWVTMSSITSSGDSLS